MQNKLEHMTLTWGTLAKLIFGRLQGGELRGVPGCSSLLQGVLGRGQESGFLQQCATNSNCKSSIPGVQESGSSPLLLFFFCQSFSTGAELVKAHDSDLGYSG